MRATQMDDDLDTPIQQLIKVVSTHEEIISKLESASDKFLRCHHHEGITLRSYYRKVIFKFKLIIDSFLGDCIYQLFQFKAH